MILWFNFDNFITFYRILVFGNRFLGILNGLTTARECLAHRPNEWLRDLAFLVDITGYLNNLNLKLEGKQQPVYNFVLLSK